MFHKDNGAIVWGSDSKLMIKSWQAFDWIA